MARMEAGGMMGKQYVQHVSGQGEKWGVSREHRDCWVIAKGHDDPFFFHLPKSEYALCEPPEVWRDLTEHCAWSGTTLYHNGVPIITFNGCSISMKDGYRLRKVRLFDHGQKRDGTAFLPVGQWAFIVERKEPP